MIRRGIVVAVDEQTARVRVQMPDLDGIVSNWLPVIHHKTQQDKSYWLPDVGEYVVVAFDEEGKHSDGYVLGAIYNDQDTVPVANVNQFYIKFQDGTTIAYDRQAHALTVNCVGSITINTSNNITITAANIDISASGNVTIQGATISLN